MNLGRSDNTTLLPADFARRVVERVRKARQRRRLRRRVVACVAACAAVAFTILTLRSRNLTSTQVPAKIARRNSYLFSQWAAARLELDEPQGPGATVVNEPLAFFFPGATSVADLQSEQTYYWHSYDPWWNPNP